MGKRRREYDRTIDMKKGLMHIALVTALLAVAVSCRTEICPEDDFASGVFSFSVDIEGPMQSKAEMINTQDELRLNCTPEDAQYEGNYGKGKAIGIWADLLSSGGAISKNVFDDVLLKWKARTDGGGHETSTEHTPAWYWNTFTMENNTEKPGDIYWHTGETYYFRAYYPSTLSNAILPNSNAQALIASYQAETQQEDLMVGYTKAGPLTGSNIDDHVHLQLSHALAALSFHFKFSGVLSAQDRLTGMWLENGAAGRFYNYGTMVFGNGHSYEGANTDDISWTPAYTAAEGVPMYKWSHSEGLPFSNSDAATAYTPSATPSDVGQLFTECSNWIYIVPQQLYPDTWLCFQTKQGGDVVFRVQIPTSFEDSAHVVHNGFEEGQRYQFTIVITELNVDVLITILPWNLLESTYSIDF